MKKILITILFISTCLSSINLFAQFGGGLGTSGNPYLINSATHLATIATNVNNGTTTYSGIYFKMTSDININGVFTPIGTSSTYSFKGNFNGDGYQITRLKITTNAINNMGLFGYTVQAKIENVSMRIDSININVVKIENTRIGFLIANSYNTIINSCNIGDSSIIKLSNLKNNNIIGGLVGYANNSIFNASYSLCTLSIFSTGDQNNNFIGGLIGKADYCTVNNCYTQNDIFTDDQNHNSYIGGLVGTTFNSSFNNCYSAPNSFNSDFPFSGVLVSDTNTGTTTFDNCYYLTDTSFHTGGQVIIVGSGVTDSIIQTDNFLDSLNNGQEPPIWTNTGGAPSVTSPIQWDGEGTGTQSDPFRIKYVKDLIQISDNVDKNRNFQLHYLRLENDINFNGRVIDSSSIFVPIGKRHNGKPFSGNLDGNNYSISNYYFSDSTEDNIAIFSYTNKAKIKKLGLSNIYISARINIGGLISISENTIIDSCFVYGFLKGFTKVGGLVGVDTSSTSILRSFTNTTINAQKNAGGIVGKLNGSVSHSYSNSEIYSLSSIHNYIGGIAGYVDSSSVINNSYSVSKIIRNGTNTNFGKIKGNTLGSITLCYTRDSVFINYNNLLSENGATSSSNLYLKSSSFVNSLNSNAGSNIFQADYSPNNINDGYPIFTYQPSAAIVASSGYWKSPSTWATSTIPSASKVVIVPSGKQLKIDSTSSPYIIIEKGGELYNNTDINLFGEQRRELVLGKWNFIGLTTNNPTMSFLYNYADTAYKTFVKQFDPNINNWAITTIQNNNTQLNYNTGYLAMPNYSLDAQQLTTSKIASKGVFYNTNTSSKTFTNDATKLVPLANNYNSNLNISQFLTDNSGKIQGGMVYALNANSRDWNNNLNSTTLITNINPSEGFFVFATNANSSFSFSRSQLISSAKKIAYKELMYVKAKTNDITREAFIEFNEDSENGFDVEDGLMLFGTNEDIVEPYFKKEDNEILKDAFSSLPYSTELNLRSYSSNNINLEFSNLPKDIKVYLIDSFLRKVQELNSNPLYNLGITEGNNENRLKILFTNNEKDIVNYFNTDELDNIQIWNSNSIININGIGLNRFEVYDIMGQKILQQVITSDEYQTNLNLKAGIYIIKAYSQTSISSRKISICR